MVFNILSPTCFVRIVDKKLKGVLLLNSYSYIYTKVKKCSIAMMAFRISISTFNKKRVRRSNVEISMQL